MNKVYTSRIANPDPDRLDITCKTASALGRYFAPDWSEVKAYLDGPRDKAAEDRYITAYHAKMLASYEKNKHVWMEVLAMKRVVLVCYCKAGAFCHRKLLKHYLATLGMEDGREI